MSAGWARLFSSRLMWLVAAVYVLGFPYHPGLRSPNELCRLWQSRALVDFRTIELNQAMQRWGPVGDLSVREGRYFPSKAPLLSFAAAPVYAAQKLFAGPAGVSEVAQVYFSRLFLTVLPTLFMLVLLRRFLGSYCSPGVAEGLSATYALGSLALSYSWLFMSHQSTAVLLFASFYALWRTSRGELGTWGYLGAGAAAGAAMAAEYTAAAGVAGLVVYATLTEWKSPDQRLARLGRAAGLCLVGALPFVAFLALYHQAAFGHPLHSGYKYLADAGYQPWHLGGFLGIKTPDPRAFALSFFSPLRGLFTLAPFLLLALPGLFALRSASRTGARPDELRPLFWLTACLGVVYAYFTSSFSYESWGWTTGPRHMTGLVPFLLLPAGLFIERLRATEGLEARVGLGLSAGAAASSVLVTGAASAVNYVPDSVSNPLFGLALPLFAEGYLPPTLLAFLGLPNPWSGGLLLLGLGAAAGRAAWLLVQPAPDAALGKKSAWVTSAWALAAAASFLLLLAALTDGGQGDQGAQGHLRSVWTTPKGATPRF